MAKPRVVHILGSLSGYWLTNDQTPPSVRWETTTGTWVGVFDQHWSDLLCRAILSVTDEFALEVWQPDLRADRIYSHTFEDGLTHVLFPARCRRLAVDAAAIDPEGIECPTLLKAVDGLSTGTILQLNELMNPLTEYVLRHLKTKHVPVVLHQYGGTTYASMARHGKRIWRRLSYLLKSVEQRRLCRHLDYVVVHTRRSQQDLQQIYSGPMAVSAMGADFDYWRSGDRSAARRDLAVPEDRTVLLTASLLRPKKQVDKLIRVLADLRQRGHDFTYLVVGAGEPEYEAELRRLAGPLVGDGRIRFLGRVSEAQMLEAYHAADLFLSVSSGEGGPVSVMKAFACEVPVLTTDVGNVAEFMRERGARLVVPDSPGEWAESLSRILAGERVEPVSREAAREVYEWSAVGRRFASIYREVLSDRQAVSAPGAASA